MKKLLSSVLSISLLINMCLPYAWGQRRPAIRIPNTPEAFRKAAADRVQKRKERIAELEQLIAKEKDPKKVTAYLQELEAERRGVQIDLDVQRQILQSTNYVAPNDGIKAPKPLVRVMKVNSSWQAFLAKKEANELAFEDLIEYANPISENHFGYDHDETSPIVDFRVVAQASEMIGNSVDAINKENCSDDVFEYLNNALQPIQARLLYQLYKMENEGNKNENLFRVLAIGTIRITMLKIKQFYERVGKPNPVKFASTEMEFKVSGAATSSAMNSHQNPGIHYEEPESLATTRILGDIKFKPNSLGLVTGESTQTANAVDPYEDAFEMFLSELKLAKARADDETSHEYQVLLLRAESATMYTLLYNPARLKEIVAVFDKGPESEKFKQKFSPVLNAIFINVFETVRYSHLSSAKSKQILELLKQFSDPQHYSIPTQVFALEAASLMYRPVNQEYANRQPSPFGLNFFQPNEDLRQLFAARTANIYCPLTNGFRPQRSYGLDSSQMAQLADKLAYIYDGFYDVLSTVVSAPGTESHPHPATACPIIGRPENNLNTRKRDQEQQLDMLIFVGETILWVYTGFEVFRLLGVVYRMTRGALAVMPRAAAVAVSSRGGTSAAARVVTQGAREANFVEKTVQQGFTYFRGVPAKTGVEVVTHTEPVTGVPGVIVAETDAAAGMDVLSGIKPITNPHTRQLIQGKWNFYKGGPVRDLISPMPQERIFVRDGVGNFFEMKVNPLGSLTAAETNSSLNVLGRSVEFVPLGNAQAPVTLSGQAARMARIEGRWANMFHRSMEPYVRLENGTWWASSWGRPAAALAEGEEVIMMPRSISGWASSAWNSWLKKPQIYQPKTTEELMTMGGLRTSLSSIQNGSWATEALNTYFTPINYSSTVANYLLPRYMLNKQGIGLLLKNPIVAAQAAKQAMFTPFVSQSLFFGGWRYMDDAAYGPLVTATGNILRTNLADEQNRYGDTFSTDQSAADEAYVQMQRMNPDSPLNDPRSQYQMHTYKTVSTAGRVRTTGASFELVKLGMRSAVSRMIGNKPPQLLSADVKAQLARHAYFIDNARASRAQQQVQQTQQLEAQKEDFKRQTLEDEQFLYQQQNIADLLSFDPLAKKKIHQAYQIYLQNGLAVLKEGENHKLSAEQQRTRFIQLRQQLENQVSQILEDVYARYMQQYAQLSAFFLAGEEDGTGGTEWGTSLSQEQWNAAWDEEGRQYKEDVYRAFLAFRDYTELDARMIRAVDMYVATMKGLYGLPIEKQEPILRQADQQFSDEMEVIYSEYQRMQELFENADTSEDVY